MDIYVIGMVFMMGMLLTADEGWGWKDVPMILLALAIWPLFLGIIVATKLDKDKEDKP